MQGIKEFLQKKKNLLTLVIIILLILALPLGIYLVQQTQIFRPKAEGEGIIALGEGECVKVTNGQSLITCKNVPLKLISPFEASESPSTLPSGQSPLPSSSSPNPSVSPQACDPKKFDRNTWAVQSREACKDGEQKVTYTCQSNKETIKEPCSSGTTSPSPLVSPTPGVSASPTACDPKANDSVAKETWVKGTCKNESKRQYSCTYLDQDKQKTETKYIEDASCAQV